MTGAAVKIKQHHHVLMREDERAVLRAFGRNPDQCIHQLSRSTGVPYPDLLKVLSVLQSRGEIQAAPDIALGKDDRQYSKLGNRNFGQEQFVDDRLSPLVGLTEQTMRDRVIMLKRMKRNLISEWHPVIDVILGDYERNLKVVERSREPPDPDEPDAQDRDF